jgi:acetyltransferase-like isoleucine patch superfamily enzyme
MSFGLLRTTMWFRRQKSALSGKLTRLLYSAQNVTIGENFMVDTIPEIIVEPNSRLIIGDHVTIRQNVELRVHGHAALQIGDRVRIDRGVRVLASNQATVSLGADTRIGLYSVFNGGDSISIGQKCLISGHVYLQTSMHRHAAGKFIQEQGYDHAPIILEEDVWLGAHVLILPGCTLSRGAIVGSNSVVTKDVSANTVVAGSPARFLKQRE